MTIGRIIGNWWRRRRAEYLLEQGALGAAEIEYCAVCHGPTVGFWRAGRCFCGRCAFWLEQGEYADG